jgi:Fe-S-cluster containining protein
MTTEQRDTEHDYDESALCQTCGLCCQGALHRQLALRQEEVPLAETWPVEIVTKGESSGIQLPCGCLNGLRCSVYANRPQACVKYRCKLLGHLRQNEISQVEALERVAQARRLFEEVEARLPANSSKQIWELIDNRWDMSAAKSLLATEELDSSTLMLIVTLGAYLTKHFDDQTGV